VMCGDVQWCAVFSHSVQEDICWRECCTWVMLESKADGWKEKKSCVSSA